MNITSATFVKGVIGTNETLEDGKPQIAFIGRSNAGKSSIINSLTHQKKLAKTSSFPGRTQQMNVFLINKAVYLVDLPGYGFAKIPKEERERIEKMIHWYLFASSYKQRVVLIIDANVGPTDLDMEMLLALEQANKKIIIVANKVDKIPKSAYASQIERVKKTMGNHVIIPYSSETGVGVDDLTTAILTSV